MKMKMSIQARPTYSCLLWFHHHGYLPVGLLNIIRHHYNSSVVQNNKNVTSLSLQNKQYKTCKVIEVCIQNHSDLQNCSGSVGRLSTKRYTEQIKYRKGRMISGIDGKALGHRLIAYFPLVSNTVCFERVVQARSFHTGCKQSLRQSDKDTSTAVFHRNPLDELQKFIAVPLVPPSHKVFSPDWEEIKEAGRLFVDLSGFDVQRVGKAIREDFWPQTATPEVLLMGRSNVGKSSLLKALLKKAPSVQQLAKTSKKPGRTRSLQFFDVQEKFKLVDAPGYGFNMPPHYYVSVESYLQNRKNLCRSLVLIDGEVGILSADHIGLDMMEEYKVPYVLVLTKVDKVKHSKLVRTLVSVMKYRDEHTLCCLPQPFLVSSKSGAGIQLLRAFIGYATGCLKIKSE